MRPRYTAPALAVALAAVVAVAGGSFYEAYERGLELEARGALPEAREMLLEAVRQRPEAGKNVRTYGLNFLAVYDPYLPLARIETRMGLLDEAARHLELSREAGVSPARQIAAVAEALERARGPAVPPAPTRKPEPTPVPSRNELPAATPERAAPGPPPAITPAPEATPTPSPAFLEIRSEPEGAVVLLDGVWVGRAPLRLPVEEGEHRLRVEAPGRLSLTRRVRARAGRTALVEARLAPRREPSRTVPAALPRATAAPETPTPEESTPRPAVTPEAAPPAASTAPAGNAPASPAPGGSRVRVVATTGVLLLLLGGAALVLRRRKAGRRPGRETGPPSDSDPTVATGGGRTLPPETPRRVGGYELTGVLGDGGMATTYRGRRVRDSLPVAVKIPHRHILRDAEFAERFVREGRLGSTLHHPNIVRIFEAGEENGRPFIAMELLEGETLEQRLAAAPLPVRESLEIARGIAEALDYGHMKGVIHRDLKPDNVFLTTEGTVKVMDYGIARVAASPGLTSTRTYLGTPLYSAPESLNPAALDHRADLYSLGIILYRMLTGKLPFTAPTPLELLEKHRSEPLPTPPQELPADVLLLLERLTAKAPGDRFPRAEELLVAIRAILNRI